MKLRLLLFTIILSLFSCVYAKPLHLRAHHPYRYVVQPGDTVWSVADKFLERPWEWSRIWVGKPQVARLEALYPGDVLEFQLVNGKPNIHLAQHSGEVKLSPSVRQLPLDHAIPTIPVEAIKPFLSHTEVFAEETLSNSPYVVALSGEHVSGGAGNEIYVRGLEDTKYRVFSIYRPGGAYEDPQTHEHLGHEATYIGRARMIKGGDPAILELESTDKEVLQGDNLMPATQATYSADFMPTSPDFSVKGHIIGILGDYSQIGHYDSVVIDLGSCQGMQRGDVLTIYRVGKLIADTVARDEGNKVKLPDRNAGEVMIYRVFDQVSYGLVMEARGPIRVLSRVKTPNAD